MDDDNVSVEIYDVKGVHALNVVVRNILDGGVNCSRRIDRHGKTIFRSHLVSTNYVKKKDKKTFFHYNLTIAARFCIKEDQGTKFRWLLLFSEDLGEGNPKKKRMSFTGTLDKCNACDKTVYVVDMLSIEDKPYHKSCFRCTHCKGTLVMSNYSSMDGVLYCKTHFDQLFKESGNFSKNFQPGKTEKPELTKTPSKISSIFCGTQDKCAACDKTVYPLEKVQMEGECFHKTCFRCAHGGCTLTHSSYASLDSVLYCRHHFNQLFLEKGNYAHVLQSANHRRTASGNSLPPEPTEVNAVEEKKDNGVSES